MNIEEQKQEQLWKIAKARVGFRWSFICYFLINAMLVVTWLYSSGSHSYFWPIWPMMGWGIGLAFQYFHAFHSNELGSVEEEYQKLKNKY